MSLYVAKGSPDLEISSTELQSALRSAGHTGRLIREEVEGVGFAYRS